MKSLILIIFLFCVSASAQAIDPPKVDKRVELLSIVFRLAGAPEYNGETYKDYTDAIHRHFDSHKNHKAVALAKKLHQDGAGYSYVASLAVHLEEVPNFKLVAPLNESDVKKFEGMKNINNFLTELKDFYRKSKFEEFWLINQQRYQLAETNFKKLSNDLHPEWFEEFYGRKFNGRFKIVIGMGNGNNFYGPSVSYPNKSEDIYAVFAPLIDGNESQLPGNALSFTVHEFNHSFANPMIDKYAKQFEPSAKLLFSKVHRQMIPEAYNTWQIMMYESLVRAATVTYLLRYNPNLVSEVRSSDMFEHKFLWVDAFTDLLKTYGANRQAYPNLDSFIPKLTAFFDEVTKTDLNVYQTNFEAKLAHIEMIEPFANNSVDVDADLTEIKIVFDKALDGKSISINMSEHKDEQFPEIVGGRKGIAFVNGNQEFTMRVKLKPNTKYGFVMSGDKFQTANGYPLKNYKVSFKTK